MSNTSMGIASRCAATRTILLVVSVLFAAASCVPPPQATYPRHEDPVNTPYTYSLGHILVEVGAAVSGLEPDTDSTPAILADADTGGLNLPPAMVHVWSRYRELVTDLSGTLGDLDEALAAAEAALAGNRLDDVAPLLSGCEQMVGTARIGIDRLDTATAELLYLATRFGHPADSSTLATARSTLEAAIERLRTLTSSYEERLDSVRQSRDDKRQLTAPTLTLDPGARSAWVGQALDLSGMLRAEGRPLAQRTIALWFNDIEWESTVTDSNGFYEATVQVPYEYVPRAELRAEFAPQKSDAAAYLFTASASQPLTVRYHQTVVHPTCPDVVRPGMPAVFTGSVRSLGTVAGRHVTVSLEGTVVGAAFTDDSGRFDCSIAVPEDVSDGAHAVRIHVKEDKSGLGAPIEATEHVPVLRVTPDVRLHLPSIAFYPLFEVFEAGAVRSLQHDSHLHATARVHSTLPLHDYDITGTCNGEPLAGDHLSATGDVACGSAFHTGWQRIQLTVYPAEPWHTPVSAGGRFFVVNLYVALALPLGAIALVRLALAGRTGKSAASYDPAPLSEPIPVMEAAASTGAAPLIDASLPVRHRVVRLYWVTARFAASALGVGIQPSATVSETASDLGARLPSTRRLFRAAATLTEHALYSGRNTTRRQSSTARWLKVLITRTAQSEDEIREARP